MVRAGTAVAPLFYGFVAWIIDETRRGGFDRVYYFTREGEFFAAIHRAIATAQPWSLPEASVLEVSRVATLLPSLPAVSIETLRPVCLRYPRQSPAALLKTLNLNPTEFAAAWAMHRLPADEPIDRLLDDPRLASFLGDPAVQAAIESRRAEQRTALLQYLGIARARSGNRAAPPSSTSAGTARFKTTWLGSCPRHSSTASTSV